MKKTKEIISAANELAERLEEIIEKYHLKSYEETVILVMKSAIENSRHSTPFDINKIK